MNVSCRAHATGVVAVVTDEKKEPRPTNSIYPQCQWDDRLLASCTRFVLGREGRRQKDDTIIFVIGPSSVWIKSNRRIAHGSIICSLALPISLTKSLQYIRVTRKRLSQAHAEEEREKGHLLLFVRKTQAAWMSDRWGRKPSSKYMGLSATLACSKLAVLGGKGVGSGKGRGLCKS